MHSLRSPLPFALAVAATALLSLPFSGAHAGSSAADAMVDRFSQAAEEEAAKKAETARLEEEARQRAEAERLEAQEADMLARARAEAAEREAALKRAEETRIETERLTREAEALRRAEEARASEEARQAEVARQSEMARAADEARKAEDARVAEDNRKSGEARRAEAARLAEEARRNEVEEAARLHVESLLREAESRRVAEEKAETERLRSSAVAEREEESRRLAEKLRRIREQRSGTVMGLGAGTPEADGEEQPVPATGPAPELASPADPATPGAKRIPSTKVTVLLVMEPGKTGIRRTNRTADPVLCLRSGCYVSAGAAKPARWMRGRKALGPVNTLGGRSGACRRSLACVFRGVDLDRGGPVQPINLRYLKHDRRQSLAIAGDPSCRAHSRQILCDRLVEAKGWRAWIIPEEVADAAGPEALEAALSGLGPTYVGAAYRDPMER